MTGALLTVRPTPGATFAPSNWQQLVPADKRLSPEWRAALTARGEPAIYRDAELDKIGMPVGGIGAGQLYLGGDGRLWHWDVFNQPLHTAAEHYAQPPVAVSPLDQGFAIRYRTASGWRAIPLDRSSWPDVRFRGTYPIGQVDYRHPDVGLEVRLEAFSPFIPLNARDSGLPTTVMHFTVQNASQATLAVEIGGWLENAVGLFSDSQLAIARRNERLATGPALALECRAATPETDSTVAPRPDVVLDDFEQEAYEGWESTGTAFGTGPIEAARMPAYQGDVGAHGRRLVNSHNTRQGESLEQGDDHTGTLTSRPFTVARKYLTFLLGGGNHPGKTGVELLVDGQPVRTATGSNENRLRPHTWSVQELEGSTARFRIFDRQQGSWGNVGVDYIVMTDHAASVALAAQSDYGTLALALLEPRPTDRSLAVLPPGPGAGSVFETGDESHEAASRRPRCGLVRTMDLAPGESRTATFVIAWHLPNLVVDGLKDIGGRYYGNHFASAGAVAQYVAANAARLIDATRLWRDTWYDSTLPYWLLDRTLANASTLATSTCLWLSSGRFYGWEGVGCCAGTCTHVWHYAHAMARLFPELERFNRERVDYGISFDPRTGVIQFRGEFGGGLAIDGQAGCILRVYREHQMSADDQFLRRVWLRVKRSLECLLAHDGDRDGLLDGPQHNTLDADWFGQVAWLNSLYVAALRAGQEMAREMADDVFAARLRMASELTSRGLVSELFNGEYFIQKADPAHAHNVGSYDSCEIDQVFGQSWAFQIGLERVLPERETRSALESLWKYNFTPDVGPFRTAHPSGRWYAMPGEGGLLMAAWPRGPQPDFSHSPGGGFAGYFNECMSGFEHQVAGHMLWEGLVEQGLAVERMIHDRYHPTRRNPWNEVECGDHYARAMASYGVYVAACGFEYHGPSARLGFAPRLSPDEFRAAFTAADGWGTFEQRSTGAQQTAAISVKWGLLRVQTLALEPRPRVVGGTVHVVQRDSRGHEQAIPAQLERRKGRLLVRFDSPRELAAGSRLEVTLT